MNRIAQFTMEEILPRIGLGMPKFVLQTPQGDFRVKASSTRLECLKRSQRCVRCGRKGNVWILENSVQGPPKVPMNCFIKDCPWCSLKRPPLPTGFEMPHLNLYHRGRKGHLLLMTQDHIMPRHAGGADKIENLQTMCRECNGFKGGMLPDEYARVSSNSSRVDGGSSPTGRLPSVHTPVFPPTSVTDCAAE